MRNILLIGAGRSATVLIEYLLNHSAKENWTLTVGDVSKELAEQKTGNHVNARAIKFDIYDDSIRSNEVGKADIVISLLPAHLHLPVAQECVKQKKSLVTASYVSKEMGALNAEAIKAGITLLNECGLDPGIDHMSAMQVIDRIKAEGGTITSFKSYTGGLVAPESNDNPWGYKFSWNPRNVILAGQGTAKYIENNNYKYIPYNRLFTQTEEIGVKGFGSFDGYANRDSLSYRKIYGLDNISTMLRGTLRQQGFCSAWNVFVQLGLTDDSYTIEDSEHLTYAQLIEAFLPAHLKSSTTLSRLAEFMNEKESGEVIKKAEWTGILSNEKSGLKNATPAQLLQQLLEQKWKLKDTDKDMIVMQHLFEFSSESGVMSSEKNDSARSLHTSTLVVKGDNALHTAMAKTVGLPAAIAARLILNKHIQLKGVVIPVYKEIYEPVINELKSFGIIFSEESKRI